MASKISNLESTLVSEMHHDNNLIQDCDTREVTFKKTDEGNPQNDNEERQPLKVCKNY